jgi:hypothetical protein
VPDAAPESPARFGLLASAIAGRGVDVARGEIGEPAWTDGYTIFVDPAASPRDQLRCVSVQAALLGAGSLAPDVVAELHRPASLATRYLAVEGHRALLAHEDLLPPAARSLIDREVAEFTDSPQSSLQLAANKGARRDPPECFGAIRPRQIRPTVEQASGAHAKPTAEHVPRRNSETALPVLDDDDADDGVTLHLFSSPVGGGGAIGRLLSRMFGNARVPGGGPPGADAPTHRGRGTVSGRSGAVSLAAFGALRDETDTAEPWAQTYPEWDVHRRRYRPDWCTVIEVAPKRDDTARVEASDTHALRRALARLGVGLERRHRQLQGDEIDIDAAVEARVEAIAGAAADDGVYIDSVRARRDLSVLLLLDISGSAAEPSATGAIVHELQRSAAAALAAALSSLGDRVALYAFRSQGRTAVQVVPVKRFEEPLDATTSGRLGGLVPGAYTRLGAAIRHGASVLEREGGTPRRLLVVLSDGFAYDHGYEGAYGEADARRALAEARRRGTGCLCLSIGAVIDAQALRRVFGTAAHATIPRAEQLPFVVAPLFRSALQSSEQQRRVAQRKERTRERLLIDRRTG